MIGGRSFLRDSFLKCGMGVSPMVSMEKKMESWESQLTSAEREAIDAAWLEEVKRRDAIFREQKIVGKPVDEVIARLQGKLRP
jgi:hypothetical protein